jgi:hypothetical protein
MAIDSEQLLFLWFADRLPVYDPHWPAALQSKWLESWLHLWRWACRLTVEDAIDAYIQETSK